jgi:hypothetical protein
MRPSFAVIPTNGRDCLVDCVAAISPQVDRVLLVENGDRTKAVAAARQHENVLPYSAQGEINISRWWNIGIDRARREARKAGAKQWDVAILNDDAIAQPDWFSRLSEKMRQMNVAATSFGPVSMTVLHTQPGTTGLAERMAGHAFMLAGELGVRADETMVWWCGDNDIDMQSRLKGGTVIVPGSIEHRYPDQSTRGDLLDQTAVDMQRFVDKWGFRPWNV